MHRFGVFLSEAGYRLFGLHDRARPIVILIASLGIAPVLHAEDCKPWVAKVVSAEGPVQVQRSGGPTAQPAGLNDTLCPGDRIRVGPLGRAAVQLADEAETLIRLDEGTTLTFAARKVEKPLLLQLIEGVVHVLSRIPHALSIDTPLASAAIEGTEFVLGVAPAEAELWVFEGRVRFSNPRGQLQVASGEGAIAHPGQAPERRIMVRPREAVEWALHYPPLIDLRPEAYPEGLRSALSAYRGNDVLGALAALEQVPAGGRDGRYFLLRAGLLLSVGRVAKAEAALADAELADPRSSGALALRSIIALVRNRKGEALRLAQAGAGLDPRAPLPQAALSYAYQGRFEIEKALEHARRAVELDPQDALLWARVSELELSSGDLDAGLQAAERAEALHPALARTETVLGFAYLTRIEVERAKLAFERAIVGDPADPLPRLGLGLARIRAGDLEGAPARSRPRPRPIPITLSSGAIWGRPTSKKIARVWPELSSSTQSSSIRETPLPGSMTPSASRPPIGRSKPCTTSNAPSPSTTTAQCTARSCSSTKTSRRAARH